MIRPLSIAHSSDVHLHDGHDGQHVRDAFARVIDTLWHIGMAHGLYTDDPDADRSSLITPQEIADSGFDYLALGHVHAHRQMRHGNTLACYPGVPAPYYGTDESGCMTLVQLTPGAVARVTAHTLGPRTTKATRVARGSVPRATES
jgi:DNA repair exonuclease SbcCD nuclease subunit